MDSVMLVITLAALGLCLIMVWVTARLLREERRRSAARIAMLETAIAGSPTPVGPDAAESGVTRRLVPPAVTPSASIAAIAPVAAPRAVVPVDVVPMRAAETREPRALDTPVAASELFATPARAGGFRFAGVVLAGVALVALAIGAMAWSGSSAPEETTAGVPEAASRPLELVALSHARTGEGLTISGMVRNPDGGISRAHLTAVVFVFDQQGTFLTSTRAAIEPVNLDPGSQSSFAVTVPQARGVSRYRVSFRTDLGVIPHVDRRAGAPVERTRG